MVKFQSGSRRRALEYEKDIVNYWKENKTFEKSIELRPKENAYVFYDGPPFISGVPHHGTLLSSIVKDAVPRYQTMQGRRVERVWGWDCHGLPAERFTEKKLGINSRQEVIEYGIEKYIVATRENMVQTSSLWEDTIDRIGRWVDFKGAYKTMDKEYMESIWWAFKTLYEKGKIYEGEKVLMYCTLDATPLSKAEVTMDAGAYQDVTDPSVYTKFKLVGDRARDISLAKDAKVLFVCHSNASRSHMAQGFYNHLTSTKNGYSAGVNPDAYWDEAPGLKELEAIYDDLKPDNIKTSVTMAEVGVDITDQQRIRLTEEVLGDYDLVVNIAQRSQTPEWLKGDNVVWWDIADPRGESWDKNTIAREKIKTNVEALLSGRLIDDSTSEYLLAWTTTPWTLPANTALAVNPDVTYVQIEVNGETLTLAKDLVETVLTDEKHAALEYKVLREFSGKELVSLSYEPLFPHELTEAEAANAHKIWAADYVTTESGTGIVHIAPAYGEEDFALARTEKIPVVHVLDENGEYTETEWKGANVWEINKTIAKTLLERGVVWKIDYIRHSYPHCHRCGTKLMYRAHPSWFMDVDTQREQMLEQNGDIEWFPSHVKKGRFAKTIEQAPDWNISRDRFWATAMPVWKGVDAKGNSRDENGNEYIKVIGSYAELKELSGIELPDYHRPWIDDVTFEENGITYTRIDKVMDSWFEAGSMPFAQFHYPFENKDKFEANFPGDFIVEYIGQVRAWFYYMHAMSVALFGENSFKNVIVTGNVAGNDGRKMSKSYGNYTDPNELMDKFSADSLRFLLLSSPLLNGEDFALQDKEVGDVARKLSMVWNMYDFFTMYAEVDGWEFDPEKPFSLSPDNLTNPLDKWVVSRLHQLNEHVTKYMDEYNLPDAMSAILPYVDDASNWFVRRSRRRFWKGEDDADKNDAYRTLHYVLLKLSVILAPFTPFMAEELYQKLGGGNESVHLLNWPTNYSVDEQVVRDMELVRDYVNQALSIRAKERMKIRQPLASVTIPSRGQSFDFDDILKEELNVKEVKLGAEIELDITLTPELVREGLAREVIRHVQSARKDAGLNVDDRIVLHLFADDAQLQAALGEHADVIAAETLATLTGEAIEDYAQQVVVEGASLSIGLRKE